MSTYQDIRTRFQLALNEKLKNSDNEFTSYFKKTFQKKFKGDLKSKRGRHLRFAIGKSTKAAQKNLQAIFDKEIGRNKYKIEEIEPGDYTNGAKSGQYFTYIVILTAPVSFDIKNTYDTGIKLHIVNSDIAEGSIAPKALSPTGLKLKEDTPYNLQQLISDTNNAINSQYKNNEPIRLTLLSLVKNIQNFQSKNHYENPSKFEDILENINLDDESTETLKLLDKTDINIIGKDFGEVLGAIYVMKVSNYLEGVVFPSGNNPIVDFYFDGFGISSKYKKGAAPTLTGVLKNLKPEQLTTPDEKQLEAHVFNFLRGRNYSVAGSYLEIAKQLQLPGLLKLAEILGVKPTAVTLELLQKEALRIKDENLEVNNLYKDYYQIMGRAPSGKIDWNRFKNTNLYHGIFTGPLSYHVADSLNENPGILTALNQILKKLEVKQLYLDFILRKDNMQFKMESFNSEASQFQFEAPNQSVYNPGNGKLGFKMK